MSKADKRVHERNCAPAESNERDEKASGMFRILAVYRRVNIIGDPMTSRRRSCRSISWLSPPAYPSPRQRPATGRAIAGRFHVSTRFHDFTAILVDELGSESRRVYSERRFADTTRTKLHAYEWKVGNVAVRSSESASWSSVTRQG